MNFFSVVSNIGTYLSEFFDIILMGVGLFLTLASYFSGVAGMVAGPVGSFLGGAGGKFVRYFGLVLLVTGGCRFYVTYEVKQHDDARAASERIAVDAAVQAAEKRGAVSATAQAAEQKALEDSTNKVKTVIIHDGATKACRGTPAFNAAADELRRRRNSPGH